MHSRTAVHPPLSNSPLYRHYYYSISPPSVSSTTTSIDSTCPLAPYPSSTTTTEPPLPSISHLLNSINDNYNNNYNNNYDNNNSNSNRNIYYRGYPPPPYSPPSNSPYYLNGNNPPPMGRVMRRGVSKLPISKTSYEDFHGMSKSPRSIKDINLSRNSIKSSRNYNDGRVRKTKRPWTTGEDQQLVSLVQEIGPGLWAAIASKITGRSGKQVRERWLNHLSPDVMKRPWSKEEDNVIIEARLKYGNCWSKIAKLLQGRSDNSVKNRYYTTLKRLLKTSQ